MSNTQRLCSQPFTWLTSYRALVECRSTEPAVGVGVRGDGERYRRDVATSAHAPQQDDGRDRRLQCRHPPRRLTVFVHHRQVVEFLHSTSPLHTISRGFRHYPLIYCSLWKSSNSWHIITENLNMTDNADVQKFVIFLSAGLIILLRRFYKRTLFKAYLYIMLAAAL